MIDTRIPTGASAVLRSQRRIDDRLPLGRRVPAALAESATAASTTVRRRVQQDALGHHGRKAVGRARRPGRGGAGAHARTRRTGPRRPRRPTVPLRHPAPADGRRAVPRSRPRPARSRSRQPRLTAASGATEETAPETPTGGISEPARASSARRRGLGRMSTSKPSSRRSCARPAGTSSSGSNLATPRWGRRRARARLRRRPPAHAEADCAPLPERQVPEQRPQHATTDLAAAVHDDERGACVRCHDVRASHRTGRRPIRRPCRPSAPAPRARGGTRRTARSTAPRRPAPSARARATRRRRAAGRSPS